uniref:Myosin XVIIIB n=1 Tax=Molossus molossus TaxID=27622 RepID=A0A7J8BYU4_MOLMO|nr:myosin XVIIIB [Molossus molossus]
MRTTWRPCVPPRITLQPSPTLRTRVSSRVRAGRPRVTSGMGAGDERKVFLKAGVVSRLEKQREKLVSHSIVLFQAACKGFLSRQEFKKLKIRRLASQCIWKNVAVFLAVKDWPWWRLLGALRPLLSATAGEEQLRTKEEELTTLRQKLEKLETSRNELRQNTDQLESKIADLTTELADERFKGDVACQVLESERAERLRAFREGQELKSKYEQVQKHLGEVEKQLEEAQQKIQLHELERSPAGGADEWQTRFDCAQMENEFLRKRLQQFEERLDSELTSRKELEQQVGQSAPRGCRREGRFFPPRCAVGREQEGAARVLVFPLRCYNTCWSLWDMLVPHVGYGKRLLCLWVLPGEEHPAMKSMNASSGRLRSGPFLP